MAGRVFVLIGPGGAGKGTVAARLTTRDPDLWLSRSWTTRPQRDGEPDDAYVFTDRCRFMARADAGGFLEWAEFLGNLYGTPVPDPPPGRDVLLEIDLQGARQVVARRPDAVVILLLPPSEEVQRQRLVGRGDSDEHVRRRLDKGREEVAEGRRLARYQVVNDQVDRAVAEVAGIIQRTRREDHPWPKAETP
ncbi:MAG TPA: guanylate kinase [Acidimicrobiales bacterium]|nr:guanylate kinase [Acidimicrobiales bacterium]